MSTTNVTAMYDTRGAAEAARDGLIELGLESDQIEIHGTQGATDDGRVDAAAQGWWASFSNFFVPDTDREMYAEGVRRGGYLLSAVVPVELLSRAEDVLELSDPIDLDTRQNSWRESGWSGYRTEPLTPVAHPAVGAVPGLAEPDAAPYEPRTAQPPRGEPIVPPEEVEEIEAAQMAEEEAEARQMEQMEEARRRRSRRYDPLDPASPDAPGLRPQDLPLPLF